MCSTENPIGHYAGLPHHPKEIFIITRGMRITFGIRECVMHPVHDGIYPRTYIRGTLGEVSPDVKKTFPAFSHEKCAMCRITVLQKALHEERKIPMANQEYKDNDHMCSSRSL
jgi:hypothetical protein